MKLAILGTGAVCRTLAPAFLSLGHAVVVGTRDPEITVQSNERFAAMAESHPALVTTFFADAVVGADLVVNAVSGPFCVEVLSPLAEALRDTVVMDVSSPSDFADEEMVLDPVNTDSLGERLQRALPASYVVKTLNTLAAGVMADPAAAGSGDHSVFVSGDSPAAKVVVAELLRAMGWKDVVDLGGIRTARATEMMLPMWMSLSVALGTDFFGWKIVR